MTTCWFCNRRPAEPGCEWTTQLVWNRPRTAPPPVDHDEIVRATPDIRRLDIHVPRCRECRRRARLPVGMNIAGICIGGGLCAAFIAAWAFVAGPDDLPHIRGTWYPLAVVSGVAGALVGFWLARLWHPKKSRRSGGEYPALRGLAAEGWIARR